MKRAGTRKKKISIHTRFEGRDLLWAWERAMGIGTNLEDRNAKWCDEGSFVFSAMVMLMTELKKHFRF